MTPVMLSVAMAQLLSTFTSLAAMVRAENDPPEYQTIAQPLKYCNVPVYYLYDRN
jgi:hypothetical protein